MLVLKECCRGASSQCQSAVVFLYVDHQRVLQAAQQHVAQAPRRAYDELGVRRHARLPVLQRVRSSMHQLVPYSFPVDAHLPAVYLVVQALVHAEAGKVLVALHRTWMAARLRAVMRLMAMASAVLLLLLLLRIAVQFMQERAWTEGNRESHLQASSSLSTNCSHPSSSKHHSPAWTSRWTDTH